MEVHPGNSKEPSRQIQQMVNFILNEAKDKAEEVDAKTMEEFNIEKLKLVHTGKEKLRRDFELKTKKTEIALRIARSSAINKARLHQIEEAHQALVQVEKDTRAKLLAVTKDAAKYKPVLIDLIVQGCLALLESQVTVRCKEEDATLVASLLKSAATQYAALVAKHTGAVRAVNLSLDAAFLPGSNIGGVVLATRGGAIRVDNSLDTRLNQLLDKDKPAIKKLLFPKADGSPPTGGRAN